MHSTRRGLTVTTTLVMNRNILLNWRKNFIQLMIMSSLVETKITQIEYNRTHNLSALTCHRLLYNKRTNTGSHCFIVYSWLVM